MSDAAQWRQQAAGELEAAESWWRAGNAGRGRVGARRAAGMAIKARLAGEPRPDYGTSFMHHLNALADDADVEVGVREAAWRLAARPRPEAGWQVAVEQPLTPTADARRVMDWALADA